MSTNLMANRYWENYFDSTTVAQFNQHCQSEWIESTGVRLQLDLYLQADRNAPVIIFNHGGGGYSRLFAPIALAMHARGFSVVLPNQRGQGFSEGDRGNFTMGQFVENVTDAAVWVRAQFTGPVILAGGSIGSALVYAAAAAGAPVDAVVCHNLYDFGRADNALAVSRFAPLAKIPGFPALMAAMIKVTAAVVPWVRLPFGWLGDFGQMVDERDAGFFALWQADPLPIRWVSMRYLASTFRSPPAKSLEENTHPILVINPTRDKMVAPEVTYRNYLRLGGPKTYVEIPYGHWAVNPAFYEEYADILTQYIQSIGVVNMPQ